MTEKIPIEIEVNKKELTIHPMKKKKALLNEAQLSKGLTPQKAHADEIMEDADLFSGIIN